jgi:hypothetical protein
LPLSSLDGTNFITPYGLVSSGDEGDEENESSSSSGSADLRPPAGLLRPSVK